MENNFEVLLEKVNSRLELIESHMDIQIKNLSENMVAVKTALGEFKIGMEQKITKIENEHAQKITNTELLNEKFNTMNVTINNINDSFREFKIGIGSRLQILEENVKNFQVIENTVNTITKVMWGTVATVFTILIAQILSLIIKR